MWISWHVVFIATSLFAPHKWDEAACFGLRLFLPSLASLHCGELIAGVLALFLPLPVETHEQNKAPLKSSTVCRGRWNCRVARQQVSANINQNFPANSVLNMLNYSSWYFRGVLNSCWRACGLEVLLLQCSGTALSVVSRVTFFLL